ncbi:MAG: hypothetical protein R2824_24145 [Saprospiraceae bacterium]
MSESCFQRVGNPFLLLLVTNSIKASRNDVVIALIRGGSDELIDKAEAQLRALVLNGFDRLGIILCDLNSEDKGPVIGIFSNGAAYTASKDAKADTVAE